MGVYKLDPLTDPRWQEFVDRHPDGSLFHTTAWLNALCRTYGYEPVIYTTTPPGQQLSNGLAFCNIQSWLSGARLISVPFSDHCQPLADAWSMAELMEWLRTARGRKQWKYIELRPLHTDAPPLDGNVSLSESFSLHFLDLRPDLCALFRNFHRSCVQRKIQRAEREGLSYEEGRSDSHLKRFYHLLLLTRRRHGLPPQPRAWFRNVIACLGDRAVLRIASKDGRPVASILTIQHKSVVVYKYGCTDARFNNLGGNALLFWKAIQDAKARGAHTFDFGRSEPGNSGLVSFKENWGATSFPLHYYRLPATQPLHLISGWPARLAKSAFSLMPDSLLAVTGKLLYRHIG